MNKSWESHEEAMTKSWLSHEQVVHKLRLISCYSASPEQVMNVSWTIFEQVKSIKLWGSHVQDMSKSWTCLEKVVKKSWVSFEQLATLQLAVALAKTTILGVCCMVRSCSHIYLCCSHIQCWPKKIAQFCKYIRNERSDLYEIGC